MRTRRTRRTRRTWWGAAVAGAALAAGWSLGLAGAPRAEAGPGLSALCERTAMSVVPTSLVFTGDAVTGERHQLALPASAVATTPDADGSPSITAANLQPLHLDNDGRADLEVALGIRSSTAPEAVDPTGATPLDGLLTENFGFMPDSAASGVGVGVTGVDLVLRLPADPSTSWIRRVPQDKYAATVGFRLERVLLDQSGRPVTDANGRPVVADHLEVEMRVDALQAAARAADQSGRFPDEARLSFVLKSPGDAGPSQDHAIWGVGQEIVLDGAASPVPLDTGVAVSRVATGQERGEPLLDLDLAWDQVPEDFASGVGQTCPPPTGGSAPAVHLAGNLPRTADSGHDVEVALRSGIDAGLGGGDELRFEGRVDGVPRHLDLASVAGGEDRDRSLHLVGCGTCDVPDDPPDPNPNLVVDRLDVATDDPGTTADEPIHVHGRLDGVSPHVQVVTHRNATSGEVDEVRIASCPGLLTDAARDELSELVPLTAGSLAQTERAAGCVDPTQSPPGEPIAVDITDDAHLVVQNFLPDGPYGEQSGQSSGLLDPPAPVRDARTDCHYRQRGPDQPWDLVCEELPAVARTGFLLAATLHPQGPPVDTSVLLVRAGVGVRELDQARIRLEASSGRPPGEPTAPDDRVTYGARDTATIGLRAGRDARGARLLVQLDRITHRSDAGLDRGLELTAIGEIDPVPGGESTLTFETLGSGTVENRRDAVPFRMELEAPDNIDIDLDRLETQLPGRDGDGGELPAVTFAGEAEIELPVDGGGVELAESFDGGRRSTLRWTPGQTPRAAEIELAAELHTANRPDDRNLRLYGELDGIKFPASVVVDRGPDGQLLDIGADVCPVAQCSNFVDLDAIVSPSHPPAATGLTLAEGRRLDDEIAADTAAPRPWAAPRAAERNDLTVVIAEPGDPDLLWEASLDLRDLVRLAYRPVPNGSGPGSNSGPGSGADVCLEAEATVGRATTTLLKTPELWFNGHITLRRPQMRLQAVPVGEDDPDRPSIWVDTTSCSAPEPPVDATAPDVEPDTPEDAGFVDAVAILAPDTALGTGGAALAELPAPVRPDSDDVTYHMSMHTERAVDGSSAAAARLSLPVSEQLLVWHPETACESWASCHSPTWQRADRNRLGVRVQSTAAPPRALLVTANIADPAVTGTGTSGATGWRFSGLIPQLPASLHADVALDELAGPGWTDTRLDAVASEPIGRVQLEATDRSPDRVGFTGPALGPDRLPIPEHLLDLRNAGDELHITARRRDGEDVNRGAAPSSLPGGPLCRGHTATRRGAPGIAYVHTEIDLAGGPSGSSAPARELTVDVVNGKEGPRDVDPMGHLVTVSSDEPVDGSVRTRLTNIVVDQSAVEPEPIKWLHDLLLVPALADLLAGGDIDLSGCVDLDLPLELALTDASVARLAGEGSVFALDADQGPGAEAELRVGEFVGPELTHHEGIPNAYREVDYDVGLLYAYHEPSGSGAAVNDWKDTAAVPVQPGSTDIGDCDALHAAISSPGAGAISTGAGALPTGVVSGSVTDRNGTVTDVSLTRATFVLDLLWSAPQRNAMALDDLFGFTGCAGSDLFRALARSGTPPVDLPTGVLDPGGVDEAEFTIDAAAIDGEVGLFCSEEGWDTALANRPDSNAGPDFPIAVGADGTRYTLNVWSPPAPGFDGCRVDLVARHPDGSIRWSRTIAPEITAPWTYQWGDFDWDVRLFPSAVDGSIEVQLLKMYIGVGGTRSVGALALARLDADGHGRLQWGEGSTLQPVLRQLVGESDRMNPPDVALGADRCTHNAVQAPFGVPADAVRVWFLGDGTQVVQPNPVDRCYRHGGTYLVQFVDYRNGRPIGGAGPWEVAAPP